MFLPYLGHLKHNANPLIAFFPMSFNWLGRSVLGLQSCGCVCHMCSSWQVARLVEQERVLVGWLVCPKGGLNAAAAAASVGKVKPPTFSP